MIKKYKLAEAGHENNKLWKFELGTGFALVLVALAALGTCAAAKENTETGNTAGYWLDKAYNLTADGSYEQALQASDKAIQIDPNNKNAWIYKAMSLESLNKYGEAVLAYGKALEIVDKTLEANPKDADAWSEKGVLLHNVGKYEEAVKAFDNTITIDPKNEVAWKMKGLILSSELHRYNESIKAFDGALQIDPKDAPVWSLKGNALKSLGRNSEADVAYAKARSLGYRP